MKPLVQTVAALALVWLASALSACSSVDRETDGGLVGAPVYKERIERYKLQNGVVWTCIQTPIRNLDGTVVRVEEICR